MRGVADCKDLIFLMGYGFCRALWIESAEFDGNYGALRIKMQSFLSISRQFRRF